MIVNLIDHDDRLFVSRRLRMMSWRYYWFKNFASEAVTGGVLIEISQISQESTCGGVSF